MEKIDNNIECIKGAEAIVIHNGNIVLGMQAIKRWYDFVNGEKAVIIKTLGGQIERVDEGSSAKAVVRELLEEVNKIEIKDIKIKKEPIFTKTIKMGELNPFDGQSNLKMCADFYLLEILNKKSIEPNDLPALVEMPLKRFLKLEFNEIKKLEDLQEYLMVNKNCRDVMPKYYAFMIPNEVKSFLR
jgi:DNA-binding protein